jgi:WD40 repeat protein
MVYSSNGSFIVTGSNDGIIEIWDSVTTKIKKDLFY